MAPSAPERMQRVLAMVPWIAANDGPTIDEVCARFSTTRDQLLEDLEVVWLVGLPPYTPEQLIDVVIEDDRVWIHYADYFAQPLRLTPEQGLALVAAGAALRSLPGNDPSSPLSRGLAKLAKVFDIDPDEAIAVDLGDASSDVLAALRRAIAEHRRVRIDYYTYGRDTRGERVVDPYRLHADEGALYLFARCHTAGGDRLFRVDRISAATVLDDVFDPIEGRHDDELFSPSDTDPRVTLHLSSDAAWIVEQYPVEDVAEMRGGRLRVTLAVAARPWLERLLLRAGRSARVASAPAGSGLDTAAQAAAARVLARYGEAVG
jgi:proteasome accessory factor C